MSGLVTGMLDRHENVGAVAESLSEPVRAFRQGQARQLIVLAVACLGAGLALAFLLFQHESRSTEVRPQGPELMTQEQLERFAAVVGDPVYWAGPRRDYVYEVTRTPSGRVFVRYLKRGFVAGDTRASFLTVGTYPTTHAYDNLERAARRPGADSIRVADDGVVVSSLRAPASAYLAYPGSDYQVEVYNPVPGHSLRLLQSGAIRPVG